MSVASRLRDLEELISTEDPFSRLPDVTFLDAQAVIQWVTLGVLEEVLNLLPRYEGHEPRFRLQDAAFHEVVSILHYEHGLSRRDVATHLQSLSDVLTIDDNPLQSAQMAMEATYIRTQMAVLAHEDPDENPKRHLGEAETIAVIEAFAPGSFIVTADRDVRRVVERRAAARHVYPLTFVAGVVAAWKVDDVRNSHAGLSEVWRFACHQRDCMSIGGPHDTCIQTMSCVSDPPDPRRCCAVHSDISGAEDLLDWMMRDLNDLGLSV